MMEELIVRTTLSEKAYYRFRTWLYIYNIRGPLMILLPFAYFMVIMVNIANIFYGGADWYRLIIADFFVLVLPFVFIFNIYFGMKKMSDNDLVFPVEYSYEFNEAEIIENDGKRTLSYKDIVSCNETKDFIYIVINTKKGFILTKNDFNEEITNKIKQIIVNKVDKDKIRFKK